ncbi:MAG TPA: hypothetical protein VGM77_07095 [Gemmatimonadales bacterium]|jgi:hypothetical protein
MTANETVSSNVERIAGFADGLIAGLESVGTWVWDALLFVLLWLALVPLPWRWVRIRGYEGDSALIPSGPTATDAAEFAYLRQRENSGATDDKAKLLLTLSSSLATIVVTFGHDARPRWLFVTVVSALVASVILCISVFGVRTGMEPIPEKNADDPKGEQWSKDVLRSAGVNQQEHRYRTDRYRAATRYFRLALVTMLVTTALISPSTSPSQTVANAIERLRLQLDSTAAKVRMTVPTAANGAAPDPHAKEVQVPKANTGKRSGSKTNVPPQKKPL